MLVKAVLVFLLAMVLIAWIGGALSRRLRPPRPATCPACGRPKVGGGRCPCGGG